MNFNLHLGDCLETLKTLPDCSVDSVITDPPYGLSQHTPQQVADCLGAWLRGEEYKPKGKGFMGKSWDAWVPSPAVWRECLRVLKPGGHLLAFAGTRSMDLMSMAVRLAGFELRDSIGYAHDGGGAPLMSWCYGVGFPKSSDVSKKIDQQEKNRWVKISKTVDNANLSEITELWINSKNANAAGLSFQKKGTEAGLNTQKSGFARGNVLLQASHKNCDALAVIAELNLTEAHPTSADVCSSAQSNVESTITALKSRAITAENSQESHEATQCMVDFSALQSAWGWQSESKADKLKAVEALKTWLGSNPSSRREVTGALCAALTDDLKLITLSRSKTFLSFDTTRQMACASAISATITVSTAESLISFTADTLKSKAIDKAAGAERQVIGQDTKARSTAGASALPTIGGDTVYKSWDITAPATDAARQWQGWGTALKPAWEPIILARKPLDGTVAENVLAHGTGALNIDGCRVGLSSGENTSRKLTDPTGWKNTSLKVGSVTDDWKKGRWPANLIHDGSKELTGLLGSAARFFYCAKASKKDRDELNIHPTVKPTDLMRYLCRLVTPPSGTVLDPFTGSGSTGKAAILEGFNFIGCEMQPDYHAIAHARISAAANNRDLLNGN